MLVPIALAALALNGFVPQETATPKVPQKGDTVVVKGCLKGSSLESTETAVLNSDAPLQTDLLYRLTGDKSLLKKMKQHDNKVIEVTGVLKSTLPPSTEIQGKTIGKTRITIGVGSSHVGSPARAEANRSIPVLEVKSYEAAPFDVRCGG